MNGSPGSLWSAFVDSTAGVVLLLGEDGRVESENRPLPGGSLAGTDLAALPAGHPLRFLGDAVAQARAMGRQHAAVAQVSRHPPLWLDATVVPLRAGGAVVMVADVTGQAEEERAAREGAARWHALAAGIDATVFAVAADLAVQFVNRGIAPATPESIVGKSVLRCLGPEHHDAVRDAVARACANGEATTCEASLGISAFGPGLPTRRVSLRVLPLAAPDVSPGAILVATDAPDAPAREPAAATVAAPARDAAPVAAPVSSEAALTSLPVLDVRTGMLYVGGNRTLYEKLARSFIANHAAAVQKVAGLMASGAMADAARLAHSLKGLAGTLGAKRLEAAARALDSAMKGANPPGPTPAEVEAAEAALAATVRALQEELRIDDA